MTTSTSRSVREALAALPTASISDALDFLGLPGSLHGIGPLCDATRTVGPAFTVQYEPVNPEQPGTVGDFLDDVAPGSVVVIDNDGRTDCTVWGGIMTRTAATRGIAGTVIHGTCRDVPSILDVGYPMWSTARFMRTGKDRVQLRAVQVPLLVDGVTIHPGDWVCADADGALVVPADRVHEVIEAAQRIERTEEAITNAVLAGSTLTQARATHGYHTLQTTTANASAANNTTTADPENEDHQ
jgi:regulator of RNase E activity RraA